MLFQFDTPLNRLLETAIVQRAAGKLVEAIVTGNPAVFDTDVAQPLARMLVPFSPVQAGTGDPSPTNIRPITGFTGVTAYRTGKNLLDVVDTKRLAFNSAYGNFSSENGVVSITGNATGGYIMPCSPETDYVYSFETTYRGDNLVVRVYEFSDYPVSLPNGTLIYNSGSNATKPPAPFTTTSNGHWLVVGFYAHHSENITIQKMQVEVSETATATAYEPYTGNSFPVAFPVLGANLADNENGTIYNRTISTTNERWALSDSAKSIAVKCKPNTTYCGKTFNSSMTIFRVGTIAVDPDESTSVQNIPLLQNEDVSGAKQFTITTDADAKYIVIQGNGTIISGRTGQIMVVEGSTMPTAYEPYTNTVYGGSLDLVSGVLTVDKILLVKNTANMDNSDHYPGWKNSNVAQYVGSGVDIKIQIPTNVSKWYWANTKNTTGTIYWAQSEIGYTQTELIALALDVQIIIPLSTPFTVQLDPVTIQTLIGTNTLWTDTNGTNEITYMQKG